MRRALFLLFAPLACGAPAAAPPPASTPASAPPRSEPPPPSTARCDTAHSALTVRLKRGQTLATPTGIEVTFAGTGHDDFADGRFDDWVELRFRRADAAETRMVSIHGEHRVEELLGACWTLRSAGSDQAVIVFYPLAS